MKYGEQAIEDQTDIEVFENPGTSDYSIHIEHPEFTCLCPRSGYPDFGTIIIDYVPDKICIELKSWKLYINRFRNTNKYHEAVVNEIADYLMALRPKYLRVVGDFLRRGNVKTIVTVKRGDVKYETLLCNERDLPGSTGRR